MCVSVKESEYRQHKGDIKMTGKLKIEWDFSLAEICYGATAAMLLFTSSTLDPNLAACKLVAYYLSQYHFTQG